ncbi:hypothetical protein GCM10010358_05300 [Streptomyces minutiscleroticus]|uniref:Uncharacterized protein n=1 Tax=Streptomyces minutiscleroticus TaxID=68238 RepID=A0A918K9W8_9ACTN|nr:hypothetical protein GCM10010358_05300 [Streptomyces minutiscleroticus]
MRALADRVLGLLAHRDDGGSVPVMFSSAASSAASAAASAAAASADAAASAAASAAPASADADAVTRVTDPREAATASRRCRPRPAGAAPGPAGTAPGPVGVDAARPVLYAALRAAVRGPPVRRSVGAADRRRPHFHRSAYRNPAPGTLDPGRPGREDARQGRRRGGGPQDGRSVRGARGLPRAARAGA